MTRFTYNEFLANPAFRFRVQVFELHAAVPVHSHEFMELAVILGGAARHQVNGDIEYPIGAGDVFVINRNTEHGYQEAAGLRICNILYDPDQVQALRGDMQRLPGYHALFYLEPAYRAHDRFESRLRLEPDDLARVAGLIDRMDHEQRQQGAGGETMIQALFAELVVELVRCYSRQRAPVSPRVLRLSRVMAHIDEHCAEPIRLDDLAALAHMSKNTLLRVFRQVYKTSPADYLIRLRLARACNLMRHRDRTLSEIAYEVGFSDSNYFSRQFRKIYGTTPGSYRAWLGGSDGGGE